MNGYIKRTGLVAAALLGCLGLAVSTQGASFDCGKAQSKVEHLICDNPDISKLDDELSAAYKAILQDKTYAQDIRHEQTRWITHRNYCESASCLKALYQMRIQELADMPKLYSREPIFKIFRSQSEKPDFDNETDKLDFMRKIVKEQKFTPPRPELSFESGEYCQQFFRDFVDGKGMVAVEPEYRINDENDPRLEKWNHSCEDKGSAAEDSFDYLGGLGGPPYRHYKIDVDGNPKNGKEDVFYTDVMQDEGVQFGNNDYFWIDLNRCVVAGGAGPTTAPGLGLLPPNTYYLTLLVRYRNKYLSVGLSPYSPDHYNPHDNIYYGFGAMDISGMPHKLVCGKSPDLNAKQRR
jgi:uncharacterized protein